MAMKPGPGEKYRHKEKMYQVITVAKHSETGEELVVYQALYGDFAVYAKPLSRFFDEDWHGEYQDTAGEPRFEHVEGEESKDAEGVPSPSAPLADVDPKLMEFLETDDLEERYNILVSMHDTITDGIIDTMAVVMDAVIPDGDLMKRYDDLRHVIQTRQRYEFANRLR